MAFCEVSQDQSPGTPAAAGDLGFKVLTASDPAEKTKKLSAELANGRLEVPMSYLEDMIDTSVQWGNLSPADSVCMSYTCTRDWSDSHLSQQADAHFEWQPVQAHFDVLAAVAWHFRCRLRSVNHQLSWLLCSPLLGPMDVCGFQECHARSLSESQRC